MAGRGRKSADALATPILPGERFAPPGDLDPAEAAIWTRIVDGLPADWFSSSNAPLLKNLCRHIRSADLIAQDIAQCREDVAQARAREAVTSEPKARGHEQRLRLQLERALRSLLSMHGFQSDRVVRLSTKLRLSKLAQYQRADAAAAAPKSDRPRPWEDWPGGRRQ
jgi:hypothetical protein